MLVYQRVPSKITWMFQPAMLADPAAGCGKLRLPIRFTGQVQVVIKWVLKRWKDRSWRWLLFQKRLCHQNRSLVKVEPSWTKLICFRVMENLFKCKIKRSTITHWNYLLISKKHMNQIGWSPKVMLEKPAAKVTQVSACHRSLQRPFTDVCLLSTADERRYLVVYTQSALMEQSLAFIGKHVVFILMGHIVGDVIPSRFVMTMIYTVYIYLHISHPKFNKHRPWKMMGLEDETRLPFGVKR